MMFWNSSVSVVMSVFSSDFTDLDTASVPSCYLGKSLSILLGVFVCFCLSFYFKKKNQAPGLSDSLCSSFLFLLGCFQP